MAGSAEGPDARAVPKQHTLPLYREQASSGRAGREFSVNFGHSKMRLFLLCGVFACFGLVATTTAAPVLVFNLTANNTALRSPFVERECKDKDGKFINMCRTCEFDSETSVCANGECLNCFLEKNADVCRAAKCGPFCGGGDRMHKDCRYCGTASGPGIEPHPKVCVDDDCVDCDDPKNEATCVKAQCIEPRPKKCEPGHNCQGCAPGKVCVSTLCLDCNAIQNYRACYAAGCGR